MSLEDLRIILREAPFGQLARYITGNRIFLYPEELPGFKCPHGYDKEEKSKTPDDEIHESAGEGANTEPVALEKIDTLPISLARPTSSSSSSSNHEGALHLHPTHTLPWTPARLEAEIDLHKSHTNQTASPSHPTAATPIVPTKTLANAVLVDWYTTSDPSNPQNWSQAKKAWVTFLICLYTFVVYASSSIYVSSVELVRERFGVGEFKAGLGLALYVLGKRKLFLLVVKMNFGSRRQGIGEQEFGAIIHANLCAWVGYGIGPLVFAPLSEGTFRGL